MGVPIYYGLSWIYHGLSWIIPYFMENKGTCSKPTTRHPSCASRVPYSAAKEVGVHRQQLQRSAEPRQVAGREEPRKRDLKKWKIWWKMGKNLRKLWKTWNFEEDLVVGAMILLDFLLLSIFHRGKTMVFNRNRGFFCRRNSSDFTCRNQAASCSI